MTHFETPPILITGMSGGGLSSAAKVFEDKGYYVAHNIPPRAIVDLLKLCNQEETPVGKVAAVTDVRSRMFPGSLLEIMEELTELHLKPTVLFLDARDDVLIRRFDSVRRTHPLQEGDTLKVGIQRERQAVADVRAHAAVSYTHLTLPTSDLV